MRAVVCPRAPIPPSELVYTTDHPEPEPKEGHVLIRVKAYGLNRSELFTRQGHSPGIQFPRVLGIECVGIVKDAGGGSKWKEGDVVAACMGGMGRQSDGTWGSLACSITEGRHFNVVQPIRARLCHRSAVCQRLMSSLYDSTFIVRCDCECLGPVYCGMARHAYC